MHNFVMGDLNYIVMEDFSIMVIEGFTNIMVMEEFINMVILVFVNYKN